MKDSGAYTNNLKKGLWKIWYKNGVLESTGKYVNNQMEGEWEFFREDGTRSTKEKYMNSKVVSLECFDEQGNPAGSNCAVLKPAVPLGKFDNFDEYALNNMFWPKELKNSNVGGDVIIEYTISKEGRLLKLKTLTSPHPLLEAEALRFFKTLMEWSPAISHNRPIEYTATYKVPFYR
jgi:TonB family protein